MDGSFIKSSASSENTFNGMGSGIPKRVTWLLLLGFAALIALTRLHNYNEPTDRDQATYAVMAHEVLSGERLYDGVLLDQKPPAIHVTYGIAEWIAGYGRRQIYLLSVVAAIVTMLGFYFAGRTFGDRAGLWAAALWTIVSGHLQLEANQPNSEVFINAWTVIALAALLRQSAARWSWCPAALAGVCFAAASLYKHVVVLIPAFVLLAYVYWPREGRTRKTALLDMAIIGGIGVLAWGMMFAYFAATARLDSVINCLFTYNRHYSGNTQRNLFSVLTNPEALLSPGLLGLTPLILTALFGTFRMWMQRQYFRAAFLAALAIGTQVAVALPGRFYPHYYQLWFPFLILGTVAALESFGQTKTVKAKMYRFGAPVLALLLIAIEAPAYFESPTELSFVKYGEVFVTTDRLAKKIKALLKPGETFWQLGSQVQLYMDTKQRPQGALSDYGLFSGPLSAELLRGTMESLQAHPPDLLVVEKLSIKQIPEGHPMLSWIEKNYYRPQRDADYGLFFLMVRNGSTLEERLHGQPK
ncbi:MAG: hypothetical protein JWM68_1432 [Verrucomicrobiales bacterium]|nr:hypothetical protein [Verrucomicrobiales bacterium]